MADEKISQLPVATTVGDGDAFVVVQGESNSQLLFDALGAAIGLLTTIEVQTANYSANALEFVPVNATSGNVTVLLPMAPIDGTGVGVTLAATASSHTCTVQTQGSDVFLTAGGSTTTVFSTAGQAQIWTYDISLQVWYPSSGSAAGGGSGTVTSVTFTGDGTVLSSTPSSAVTTSGTVAGSLASQSANLVLAGPATGSAAAPTFRSLVSADLPSGLGTVTSVTFTGDGTVLSATPSSAVTTSGTVAGSLATQTANLVLAGPTSGSAAAPTFRAIGTTDLPSTLPNRIYQQITNVTIATTSGASSLVNTTGAVGSVSLGTGALNVVGRSLRIRGGGYLSTTATQGTLYFTVKLGSGIVATGSGVATTAASLTTQPISIDVTVTVKATGASGKLDSIGAWFTPNGVNNAIVCYVGNGTATGAIVTTQTTIDLTAAYTLDLQAVFSNANNTLLWTNLTVEVIG